MTPLQIGSATALMMFELYSGKRIVVAPQLPGVDPWLLCLDAAGRFLHEQPRRWPAGIVVPNVEAWVDTEAHLRSSLEPHQSTGESIHLFENAWKIPSYTSGYGLLALHPESLAMLGTAGRRVAVGQLLLPAEPTGEAEVMASAMLGPYWSAGGREMPLDVLLAGSPQ